MKSLNLISVFFSRPRKSILMLLAVSSTASALTPSPTIPLDGQPPIPTAAQSIPSWPTDSTTTNNKDSAFANDIEQLQQEIAKLKLKEQKAKLEDSIAKTTGEKTEGKPTDKGVSTPVQDIADSEDAQIGLRSIYGVGHLYRAVIDYQGAEITVNKGSDIDGHWKVVAISGSTVQIRNKTGKKKTLTLSAPQAQPAQASTIIAPPSMSSMPPVMPFALPATAPSAIQPPAIPGL